MIDNNIEIAISGLICIQCEDIVVRSLAYQKGILNVKASYLKGKVSIDYDPEIITEEEIMIQLKNEGFCPVQRAKCGIWYDVGTMVIIIGLLLILQYIQLPKVPYIDNGASLIQLFMIGLVTGTHCIVMCGGIMLSQVTKNNVLSDSELKNIRNNIFVKTAIYNISRVLAGAILGYIFGCAGAMILFSTDIKKIVYAFTGIYVLVVAMQMWGISGVRKIQQIFPSFCKISLMRKNAGPILAGIFTAVMPCMSSNSMWLVAASSGSGLKGAMTMLSWGIGTVPLMYIFGCLSSTIRIKNYAIMIRINVILMMTLGIRMLINI